MSMRSCSARIAASAPRVGAVMSGHLHPDALGVRELLERGLAEVAAVAGLADAAVGHRRVAHLVLVDPHGPGAQGPACSVRGREVVCPDAGDDSVLYFVG